MKKTRILSVLTSLLLISSMLLSFAACGEGETQTPANTDAPTSSDQVVTEGETKYDP